MPIFWAHGVKDAQVSFDLALTSAAQLAEDLEIGFEHDLQGISAPEKAELVKGDADNIKMRFVEYKELGHTISGEEIADLAVWLKVLLLKDSKQGAQ